MGDSAVTQIDGAFTDAMDSDVYRICLTDGASFSASTVGGTFPPNLDTQLFLLDAQGYGIYANDDAAAGIRASTLPAQHRFSPTAGGEYFLAVSQYNRDPQSSQGEIFQDNFSRMQFPDGVIFANGFGAAETLSGWNGRAPGGLGTYRITLTGTRACVPPDTTPPTVDLRSPVDGLHVAQSADVVVDFSCADEGSSGLDSCVGSTPDGEKLDTSKLGPVTVTVTARDKAGNQTVATSTVTVEDRTDPTVTLTTPAEGAVYERDEDVAADYGCADEANGSGLDSCVGDVPNGADVDTTTLGEHSFTVTATDKAGNHSSAVAHYTVVDVTAPQIALTTPSQGAVYDLGQQVTASYSCADEDGGSGLASCSGTAANGDTVDTASVGEKSFTVSATDNAGNPASKTVSYSVVDQGGPVITLSAPTDGAVYGLGDRVLADYSCADQPGGSGVASCTGTVANGKPIDTTSFGSHTFEVQAADGAGNKADQDRHLQRRLRLRWLLLAGQEPAERHEVEGGPAGADQVLAERLPRRAPGGGRLSALDALRRRRRGAGGSGGPGQEEAGLRVRPALRQVRDALEDGQEVGRHVPRARPEARRRQRSHRAVRVRQEARPQALNRPG